MVSADVEPAVGEPLAVGKVVCRVVRKLDVGSAVKFVEIKNIDELPYLLRTPENWTI